MSTTKHLMLQMDYNQKRGGEPDNWQWQDSGRVLRGATREEQISDAKEQIRRAGESKFIRGWRVIERTTVTSDELVETIKGENAVG